MNILIQFRPLKIRGQEFSTIEGQILSIRFVLSKHAIRARGRPTIQDTSSEPLDANRRNPCANGSNTPHNADRSRRVGPGRPAGCPRRTPGEARRRNLRFWLRAGLPRPSKETQGRVDTKDFASGYSLQVPYPARMKLRDEPSCWSMVPDGMTKLDISI